MTATERTAVTTVIGVGLWKCVLLTVTGTVTACAGITWGGVSRVLASARTVARTTTDDSVTLTLIVGVVEGANEGAESLLTNEVAVLAE